jgi:sugar phosphate isomerase/epimerase
VRIGVDTYSFHRMLGHLRPRERPSKHHLDDGGASAIRLAAGLGADVISLQTCFLPAVNLVDEAALLEAAEGRELVVAWGAPDGLAYGTLPAAADDAHRWIDLSARLGSSVMRIVLGGPRLRGHEPMDVRRPRTVPILRDLADHASSVGIAIAIENHGEISAADLERFMVEADRAALGVCFDSANALRMGDDPVEAARLLADRVLMIHLKDVEVLDGITDLVAGPRSVPYGAGVIPVARVLDTLDEAVRAGAPVLVELGQIGDGTDEPAFITECLSWLRIAAAMSQQR